MFKEFAVDADDLEESTSQKPDTPPASRSHVSDESMQPHAHAQQGENMCRQACRYQKFEAAGGQANLSVNWLEQDPPCASVQAIAVDQT